IRLLTGGLLVRVQPGESKRPAYTGLLGIAPGCLLSGRCQIRREREAPPGLLFRQPNFSRLEWAGLSYDQPAQLHEVGGPAGLANEGCKQSAAVGVWSGSSVLQDGAVRCAAARIDRRGRLVPSDPRPKEDTCVEPSASLMLGTSFQRCCSPRRSLRRCSLLSARQALRPCRRTLCFRRSRVPPQSVKH